jgi:ATP-binding cassette subfamily B protein/subfamily B ATP-binding cassette protein MsbA
LKFERVNFEYERGVPVIRDFEVTVRCGELIALVGRSGAGKTTITDLLARFLDPTSGRITLNGHDVRDLRLVSYRRLIAVVQQDVFLFDGSVRDNIAYSTPEATNAEIESAARKANAHDFIIRLSHGYDTRIGERGVMLSCGQRQRLAIARAFMVSPQILILDEATSNLDTESEELIQASLHKLITGKTAFVIAHRLSTVRRATNILVIDRGTIIEQGTHDALMNQRGLYYDMVARQMRFGPEEGLYQSAQLRLHGSGVILPGVSR